MPVFPPPTPPMLANACVGCRFSFRPTGIVMCVILYFHEHVWMWTCFFFKCAFVSILHCPFERGLLPMVKELLLLASCSCQVFWPVFSTSIGGRKPSRIESVLAFALRVFSLVVTGLDTCGSNRGMAWFYWGRQSSFTSAWMCHLLGDCLGPTVFGCALLVECAFSEANAGLSFQGYI